MGADLPSGRWTLPLIGPWWPGPSTTLRSAAQHWTTWSTRKQQLAQTLRNQRQLLSQNQGKTADDLISWYFQGEKSELDKAEKYKTKADALNSTADEIDYLRSRLTEIANEGNKEINGVLASKKPLPQKLAEIQAIQARCNADAAKVSGAAVNKIMAATQKILDAEGIHGDARTWAREHGFNTDDVPPPLPIGKEDLDSPVPGSSARGGAGRVPDGGATGAPAQMAGGSARGGGTVPAGPPATPPQVPGGSAWGGSGVPAGPPAGLPAGSPSVPATGGAYNADDPCDAGRAPFASCPGAGLFARTDGAIGRDRHDDGAAGHCRCPVAV